MSIVNKHKQSYNKIFILETQKMPKKKEMISFEWHTINKIKLKSGRSFPIPSPHATLAIQTEVCMAGILALTGLQWNVKIQTCNLESCFIQSEKPEVRVDGKKMHF